MTRACDVSTYDDDFFAWTQEQAAALRRIPREVFGDAVDIAHVAEEIEDLGKRDLREVASCLARLFQRMMKIESSPESNSVPHWRSEALNFQMSAHDAFSSSMRQLLAIDRIWERGGKLARTSGDATSIPSGCPFTLDELLTEDFDLDTALAKLTKAQDQETKASTAGDGP